MELPERIRAFLEGPYHCVMATVNADGSPQLTTMWYDLVADNLVVLNTTRGLLKEITLTVLATPQHTLRHLPPLTGLQQQILALLDLPPDLYHRLTRDSSQPP